MSKRTIIFGGSFDPVHNGHLIVARAIATAAGASCVLLMPTAANPLKTAAPAEASHRLAMLKLAIAAEPLFEVSDIELRRAGPSFSIDTVEQLARLGDCAGPVSLVIGADMLAELPRWRRVNDLLAKAKLIILPRPPQSRDDAIQAIESLRNHLPAIYIEQLKNSVAQTPMIDISSTDIRRRVAAGLPIQHLTPKPVAEYIKTNSLYRK